MASPLYGEEGGGGQLRHSTLQQDFALEGDLLRVAWGVYNALTRHFQFQVAAQNEANCKNEV